MENLTKLYVSAGIIILACLCWLAYDYHTAARAATQGKSSQNINQTSVGITQAKKMTFEDVVETSGNIITRNYALVSARMPGTIDEILVQDGDLVAAGKTKLFQTDKVKVTQAVEIAKQSVAVAEAGLKARRATVERVEADFEKARMDYERYQRLYKNDEAVTQNAFEAQESRYKQLKAALDEAKAAADLALSQLEQSKSNLIIANKDLADSLVIAPISGYISARYKEPGEMAGAGTPVVRIDDTSLLEISAYLPAEYYSRVKKGETRMSVVVDGVNAGELPLSYKSPTIDNKLRNFEIKSVMKNPPQGITAGTMARIKVVMEHHDGIGVPRQSVIRKTEGPVVFLADGAKAKMMLIEKGLEMDGWVEVKTDKIKEGQSVITMGQDRIKDGDAIIIKEATK